MVNKIQGEGGMQTIKIEVQGLTICGEFLVLEMGNSDIILGL